MDIARLFTTWDSVGLVVLATAAVYLLVVAATRLAGPRSLATMTSFDVAATVAVGSTVASAANLATPVAHAALTLVVLYAAQAAATVVRRRGRAERALDNSPLLLMAGPDVLDDNLRQARITEAELFAQLRRAGVADRSRVLAAVMETTGSVSVLQGERPADLDPVLLRGVRGAERLLRGRG